MARCYPSIIYLPLAQGPNTQCRFSVLCVSQIRLGRSKKLDVVLSHWVDLMLACICMGALRILTETADNNHLSFERLS